HVSSTEPPPTRVAAPPDRRQLIGELVEIREFCRHFIGSLGHRLIASLPHCPIAALPHCLITQCSRGPTPARVAPALDGSLSSRQPRALPHCLIQLWERPTSTWSGQRTSRASAPQTGSSAAAISSIGSRPSASRHR